MEASEAVEHTASSAIRERPLRRLIVWLPVAGLTSGVICSAIMFVGVSPYLYGLIFGALVGGCLRMARVLGNREWAWLVLASEFGACASVYGGAVAQMFLVKGYPGFDSPITYSIAGAIGGTFVFAGVFWPFRRSRGHRLSAVLKIMCGMICAGALGVAGRALADPLGTALWHLLHAVNLTGYKPDPTDEGMFGPANLVYSLFVVWQTGMGLVLALLLWRDPRVSDTEESHR